MDREIRARLGGHYRDDARYPAALRAPLRMKPGCWRFSRSTSPTDHARASLSGHASPPLSPRRGDVPGEGHPADAGLPKSAFSDGSVAGPIAALRDDHQRIGTLLTRLEVLLGAETLDAEGRRELECLAIEYSHALWRHIDAESSVLFPESEPLLRRAGAFRAAHPLADRRGGRGPRPRPCARRCPSAARRSRRRPRRRLRLLSGGRRPLSRSRDAWWSESEWEELDDHLGEG